MKKKVLYTNGDSWTYGEEIETGNPQLDINEKYYNTWPWFLSQSLEIPICVNDGSGGGSNDRIYRKTMEFIKNYVRSGKDPKELLIVIGWTSPERTEVKVTTSTGVIEHVKITVNDILLTNDSLVRGKYDAIESYRDSFIDLFDRQIGYDRQITVMDNLRFICESNGITYYDFSAIGEWPPLIISEASKRGITLNNYFTDTFNNVVQTNNWPRFKHHHPKPESHQKWVEILTNFIKL